MDLSFTDNYCLFVPAGQPDGNASFVESTTAGQGADRCVLQTCDLNSRSVALAAMRITGGTARVFRLRIDPGLEAGFHYHEQIYSVAASWSVSEFDVLRLLLFSTVVGDPRGALALRRFNSGLPSGGDK